MSITKSAVKNLISQYLDSLVVIHLKGMNVVVPNEEGQMDISPMILGVFVDCDQDYVYLIDIETDSVKSLPHESVGLIELQVMDESGLTQEMPGVGEDIH